MRRYAPIAFALLSALFILERGINGGAFASHAPSLPALSPVAAPGARGECAPRDDVLQALALTGNRLVPEPAPFCTDRPEVTDWVAATGSDGLHHLAFDAQGCLAVWSEVPCP